MHRKYTAQEMRSRADEFKEYLDYPNHFAVKEIDDDSRVLMEMLYQAADALEREEKREKKYEYAWAWNPDDFGRMNNIGADKEWIEKLVSRSNNHCKMFRRSVGEWEEVR